jgi:hypothetical protein
MYDLIIFRFLIHSRIIITYFIIKIYTSLLFVKILYDIMVLSNLFEVVILFEFNLIEVIIMLLLIITLTGTFLEQSK